jgi:hypothetical protein
MRGLTFQLVITWLAVMVPVMNLAGRIGVQ